GIGDFCSVLDPARFMPLEEFRGRVDENIRRIKSSALAEGAERILIPGELEAETRERRLAEGIPLARDDKEGLVKGAAATGTAPLDTSTPGAPPSAEGLAELFELVEVSPQPSVMVFQEVGARRSFGCHCGEVMATIAKRFGCVGVVSDMGVRDVEEVLALGL